MEVSKAVTTTAGERLRAWRGKTRTSLSELARMLNDSMLARGFTRRTDQSHLSKIERGHESVSILVATCLEEITGIPASSWVPRLDR